MIWIELQFTRFICDSLKLSIRRGCNEKDLNITREYKNAINGVVMTLPRVAVQDLLQSGVVKRIFKDYEVKVEPSVKTKEAIDPKMADSVPQIGVDKMHAENITGKGIKVGVLDTGVDCNHRISNWPRSCFLSTHTINSPICF